MRIVKIYSHRVPEILKRLPNREYKVNLHSEENDSSNRMHITCLLLFKIQFYLTFAHLISPKFISIGKMLFGLLFLPFSVYCLKEM